MANESRNVKQNFEARVATQLETGQSLTVGWQGIHFDPAAVNAGSAKIDDFIKPRSLGYTAAAARRTKRREEWTFQFTISVLVGFNEFNNQVNTTHRIWDIADLIEAVFGQFDLAIIDLAGDGVTELFILRFGEGDLVMLPSGGDESAEAPRWQSAAVTYNAFVAT